MWRSAVRANLARLELLTHVKVVAFLQLILVKYYREREVRGPVSKTSLDRRSSAARPQSSSGFRVYANSHWDRLEAWQKPAIKMRVLD